MSSPDLARARRRTLRWIIGLLAIAGLAVGSWAGVRQFRGVPTIDPPELELTGVPQEVSDAVLRARGEVRTQPHSGAAWGRLAMMLQTHDFPVEARLCFAQAERLAPREFRWPYLLGVSLETTDPDAASDAYRRAIRLRPNSSHARLRLAEMLLAADDADAAAAEIQAVLAREPDNARAHLGQARVAWLRGELEASREAAEEAAAKKPGQRATHELLARIYRRLARAAEADAQLAMLRKIPEGPSPWDDPVALEMLDMRVDPDYRVRRLQQLLSEPGLDSQTIRGTVRELQQIAVDHPDVAMYHAELARALILANDVVGAAFALDRGLSRHRESSELHRWRGLVYLLQKEPAKAVVACRAAIRFKPDSAHAHQQLGVGLAALGDLDGAIAAFRSAISLQPDMVEAHVQLAAALLDAGQNKEARSHLKRAQELDPDDEFARRLREKLEESP